MVLFLVAVAGQLWLIRGCLGLKLDELPHRDIECLGNANEDVNTDISRSRLDFPEVGTADPRHKGKLPLRDALFAADRPDAGSQASLFTYVLHSLSIRAV